MFCTWGWWVLFCFLSCSLCFPGVPLIYSLYTVGCLWFFLWCLIYLAFTNQFFYFFIFTVCLFNWNLVFLVMMDFTTLMLTAEDMINIL